MEKAKLLVSQSKKKKYIVKMIFDDGQKKKEMTIQGIDYNNLGLLNGKDVEVEREDGLPIKIIMDGTVIFTKKLDKIPDQPKSAVNKNYVLRNDQADGIKNPASAPYNFIPLNEHVVKSEETPGKNKLTFDKYHNGRYTGYIKLDIKTKSPIYIRDTLNEAELKQADEAESNGEKFINSDFFSPADRKRIPGSSLRGMIRNMVEIISFGKFGFFDDKRLYYRAVADTSKLGFDYKEVMVDKDDNHYPKINAGILKKLNGGYTICPSSKDNNGTQIYRINFDEVSELQLSNFEFQNVWFKPVKPESHIHKRDSYTFKLKYAKLTSVSKTKDIDHPQKGFIVSSGKFNKKHMHWVINSPEGKTIPVDNHIIKEYKDDTLRDENADLLKKLNNDSTHYSDGVPVFYITDKQGEILSFGHTGMFRLAYKKTVKDHIPDELQACLEPDIAEAIFGNEKNFASRVFFEDAMLKDPADSDDCKSGKVIKTLLGSKPTTFQHYLTQTNENLEKHPKNLAHYNASTSIRGNKMYWHKNVPVNWQKENQNDFNSKIDTKMKPIRADKTFFGNIRFENLSEVELGALMFALKLPLDCCYKLGMGKPLGLGSVEVKPKLFLSNRAERYKNLFAEWEIPESISDKPGDDIAGFKNKFERYVLTTVKPTETNLDLWEVDRMKELKTMLCLDIGQKLDKNRKIRYMQIEGNNGNEFKNRNVLPKPIEVAKNCNT